MQKIVLQIVEPKADGTRLEDLSLSLRDEVESTGIGASERVRAGDAPNLSRGLDAAEAAALMVSVPASIQAVAALITTVRGWLSRAPQERSVKVSIGANSLELSAADPSERAQAVKAFLAAVEADLQ